MAPTAARIFTTKGVKHAEVVVPVSGGPAVTHDIKGIQKADFAFSTATTEVWGDDALETVWVSSLKGTLKLTTSHLDPDIYALITGNAVNVTSTGTAQEDEFFMGTENIYTTTPVMIRIVTTARDENENAREVGIIFFSCLINNDPKIDGQDTKGVSTFAWDFDTKPASADELMAPIAKAAICRLNVAETI